MNPWSNLPDEVHWRILSFLSTPAADIIRQDVQRQSKLFSHLNVEDPDEWLSLYNHLYFAECKWDKIIRVL